MIDTPYLLADALIDVGLTSSPALRSEAYDSTVECELVSLDGNPISGTWSCLPR